MKKVITFFTALVLSFGISLQSHAQFDAGADVVSAYIWRGSVLADGPAVQPRVSYSTGEKVTFEVSAWGSYALFENNSEADLCATLGFGGFSVTVTDYYFPSVDMEGLSGSYFDYDNTHLLEVGLGYETGGFSALFAYNFAGATVEDAPGIYAELGYAFDSGVSIFAGAGDEFYGAESFCLVNIGVGYEKEVLGGLTGFGQVVLNPESQTFGIVFGVGL